MKNRILCRLMSLGTAVLLAAGMASGAPGRPVYGAELEKEAPVLKMMQSASWSEEDDFCAELTVEISGLSEWLEKYETKEPERPEAVSGEVTAGLAPSEIPSKEWETNGTQENNAKETEQRMPEDTIGENRTEANKTENEEDRSEADRNETGESEREESETENPEIQKTAPGDKNDTNKEEEAFEEENSPEISAVAAAWKPKTGTGMKPEPDYAAAEGRMKYRLSACMVEGTSAEIPELKLVTRISKYFRVDEEKLPKGSTVQELMFPGRNGGLEAGTEVTCPVSPNNPAEQSVAVKIPLVLKEDCRYSETACILPVLYIPKAEEEPGDEAEENGTVHAGTYLAAAENGETEILAKAEGAPALEKSATPADYTLTVEADTQAPKAGQVLNYQITLTNTGMQPLPLVSLENSINPTGIRGTWSSDAGQETDVSGRKAILTNLKTGECRRLNYQLKLPESLTEPVIHTVTAQAQKTTDSETTVVRGASLKTPVTALKADFAVNKSANRTTAAPGDTITYQICIRNTGERTLHSVLSTERFQSENINAQFVEKEGVTLNSSKTQALIARIPPGEVFSLDAVVVLPDKLSSKELINQVLVRTKETGERTVQSAAGVKILEPSPTAAPTEIPVNLYGGNGTLTGSAGSVSAPPKTLDETNWMLWTGILGLAAIAGGILGYLKLRKSKH